MKQFLLSATLTISASCLIAQTNQNALHFNGGNAHVEIPLLSTQISNAPGFSMAGWIEPTNPSSGFPNFDGAFGFRNESNCDFYILQLNATNYEARFRNSNNQMFTITSPTVSLNSWQHVALVFTGSALQFYHNGTLSSSIPANGTVSNPNVSMFIGKIPFQSFNFEFNGRVDDVALWNRALTAAEVNCLYEQALDTAMTGLVAYYPMNQGVAGGNNTAIITLTDVKNGYNGLISNMARTGTTNNFLAGVNKVTSFSDSICQGATYNFFNYSFNNPGVYTFFASNAEGCDSLIELTLYADSVNIGVNQSGLTLTADLAGAVYQWIDCDSNTQIPNETGQSFTATTNGRYAVIIDNGQCIDTSACVAITTVGLPEDFPKAALFLYPNPAHQRVFLNRELPGNNNQLSIFSAVGLQVWNGPYHHSEGLHIAHLPAGLYWIVMPEIQGLPTHLKLQKF